MEIQRPPVLQMPVLDSWLERVVQELTNVLITTTKLDDLAAPDNNTDLNASTTAHGLLPKLNNDDGTWLDGQGNWTTPAGSGNCSIDTGTYTGDGTEDQAITGIGFQPKAVWIYPRIADAEYGGTVWSCRTLDTMESGHAELMYGTNASYQVAYIISIDADGFSVSDVAGDLDPNKDGRVYSYLALG